MDGKHSERRKGAPRGGIGRALGAGAIALAAAFGVAAPAAADEPPPSVRYAVGSPGLAIAQDIARGTWGMDACGGAVAIEWAPDGPTINARSFWANPRSAYDDPALNVECRVVFNTQMAFTWEKFCTVLVHEYGHLVGQQHGPDGRDVMSPIYRAPLPACAATPDPSAPPAPAPALAAAPVPASAGATRRQRGKRGLRRPRAHAAALAFSRTG